MHNKLKKISLFNNMDAELIKKLIDTNQISKLSYFKGKTVYEQNAECSGFDIVLSGKLTAYSLATNGSESIIFEFNKDNIIGANLLFGKHNKYPFNIYCVTDCTLLHVLKSAAAMLLKEYSFVMSFIKCLSLNSQGMNKKILMYTQKTLRENLTEYLALLSAEQKSKTVLLPISKKQLADHFAVQRPSLFRELKRMKDEGLIKVKNRLITVCHE